LFAGDSFADPKISHRIDLTTGVDTAVDFTLTGLGGQAYISAGFYDSNLDRLYVWNTMNGNMYAAETAGTLFGAPKPLAAAPAAVP
jgi:hypothetical protein